MIKVSVGDISPTVVPKVGVAVVHIVEVQDPESILCPVANETTNNSLPLSMELDSFCPEVVDMQNLVLPKWLHFLMAIFQNSLTCFISNFFLPSKLC